MKASFGIFVLGMIALIFGLLAGIIRLVLGAIVLFVIAVYVRNK